jgi:hypothetical protein
VKHNPSTKGTASPETRKGLGRVEAAQPSRPTVLLSAAGLTPQVITETLYCLLIFSRPPVDVREVRVITTRAGAARVQEQLLHPTQGWFPRFCRDFGIPAVRIRGTSFLCLNYVPFCDAVKAPFLPGCHCNKV